MPFGIPKEDFHGGFGLPPQGTCRIGYRWFIIIGTKRYEPIEKTYSTIQECKEDVYPEYKDGFYGISKVSDDEGFISVIEDIILPTRQKEN